MVLVVSDVHCEEGKRNVATFERIVHEHSPDVIFGLGDWGDCKDYNFIQGQVITVYGNHDNVEELRKRSLLLDGEKVNVERMSVGGISGIVSLKGTPTKTGTPRKKPEEFLEKARRMGPVDLLLMHEAPYMPEVFGRMWRSIGPITALTVLGIVNPKVLMVGHLHVAPALHARHRGMHVFHVDTSKGGYLLMDTNAMTVEGYASGMKIFKVTLENLTTPDAII